MSPVSAAMREPRAAKDSMRELWVELARDELTTADENVPLYLTLAGADGLDVQALIEGGVLEVTETGAIAATSAHVVVAVESSSRAELELKTKFPGLQVIKAPIQDVMSGIGQTKYPTGDPLRAARSTIINLDFNQSLDIQKRNDALDLWLMQLLKKIAQVHADPVPTRWFLLLTLNSTINWDVDVSTLVAEYLKVNAEASQKYADSLRHLVGPARFEEILSQAEIDFRTWTTSEQQNLLLAFVPKRIAFETHHHGWVINTRNAVRYGGESLTAPMTSWVLEFVPDKRGSTVKHQLYLDSIELCIRSTQLIDADGNMEFFEHASA